MRRALTIDEHSLGADHPTVAVALNNLATFYMNTNRMAEAEPLLRRALSIKQKILGDDDPSLAKDLKRRGLWDDLSPAEQAEVLTRSHALPGRHVDRDIRPVEVHARRRDRR